MKKSAAVLIVIIALLLCACGQETENANVINGSRLDVSDDSVRVLLNAEDYHGENIDSVIADFENAGFKNIDTIPVNDLTSEMLSLEGTIADIWIGDSNQFQAGQLFSKDALVKISYHQISRIPFPVDIETTTDKAYIDLAKQLAEAGFVNIETDEIYDLSAENYADGNNTTVIVGDGQLIAKGDKIPFDTKIQLVGHYPISKQQVEIAIDFYENWFFSKYGVVFSFGKEDSVTLGHGESKSFSYEVPEGLYALKFVNQGNSKIVSEIQLQISGDTKATYRIQCHSDRIAVTEQEVTTVTSNGEEIKANYSANYYLGKEKDTCISALQKQGFTNITQKAVKDTLWGKTRANRVVSVSIAGKTDYYHGDVFPHDAQVVVSYHVPTVLFSEKAVSVTEGDIFSIGYTLSENDYPEDVTIEVGDETVLKIRSDTEYEALKPGVTEIRAVCKDECLAKCTVIVEKLIIPISSIAFDTSEMTVSVGASFKLGYTYEPQNANYLDVIATISDPVLEEIESGVFYASKAGTAQITLSQNGMALAIVTVHAVDVPVETLSVNDEPLAAIVGKTKVLEFSLLPSNATGITLDVQTKDPRVATVTYDKKGPMQFEISGVTAGTTVLVVKSGEKVLLEKEIKVEEILPTEIKIAASAEKLYAGESGQCTVKYTPVDVSKQVVAWSSSAPKIVQIDSSGAYKAVAPGKATITATHASGVSDDITIEVLPVNVESIRIVAEWDSAKAFTKGKKMTLTAQVMPSNATDKEVTWESSDKSVATVSKKGVVTAVFAGTTTITAQSKNGVTASFEIEVAPTAQKFKVTYTLTRKSTNHVGNSWKKGFEFNDKSLKSGKTVSILPGEEFTICGWAEEQDSRPDLGSYFERLTLTAEMCKKGFVIEEDFYVTENQGRYSNYSARWHLKVTFKPVN